MQEGASHSFDRLAECLRTMAWDPSDRGV